MSKAGGWVPLDKNLVKTLPHDRPYSVVEAVFSHTVDLDCGRNWSVNGYAQMWGWSRNKVRKLVSELRTGRGHEADRKGTGKGHAIHYIDKGLWDEEDRKRTGRGQEEDRKRDTTINPLILNPKKKKEKNTPNKSACVFDFEKWPSKPTDKILADWLKVRKTKRLELTQTAINLLGVEVTKACYHYKLTVDELLAECIVRSWGGFRLSWLEKEGFTGNPKREEDKKCAGCGILREFGPCNGKTESSRACARYEASV